MRLVTPQQAVVRGHVTVALPCALVDPASFAERRLDGFPNARYLGGARKAELVEKRVHRNGSPSQRLEVGDVALI